MHDFGYSQLLSVQVGAQESRRAGGRQAGEQVGGQVHAGVCAEVGRRVRWTASAIVG